MTRPGGTSAAVLPAPRSLAAPGWLALVAAGCLLLAARAWLPPVEAGLRPIVGVVLFAGLLAASVLVPATPAPAPAVNPGAGLALGVGAVGLAALAGGTPVPLVAAAWTLPVSILAAVAEEALFRRVAFGGLLRFGPVVAVVGSAALFALVHVPLYGVAVLPVDLGAGLVFGWQRWATGSWAVPAATHAAANVLAVFR